MNDNSSADRTTPRPAYERPQIESIGTVADLTLNGFSQGNDIGKGKSGGPGPVVS